MLSGTRDASLFSEVPPALPRRNGIDGRHRKRAGIDHAQQALNLVVRAFTPLEHAADAEASAGSRSSKQTVVRNLEIGKRLLLEAMEAVEKGIERAGAGAGVGGVGNSPRRHGEHGEIPVEE